MSCDHQRIVDYVHGELEASDASACADHLASCAACRREVEELEDTRALLRSWPDEPPELDLAAIRAAAQTRRWLWPGWLRPSSWPRPMLPLAVAALAAFVLLAAGDIQFSYQSGRMELTVGLGAPPPPLAPTPTPADPLSEPATRGDLLASQQQSLELIHVMLQDVEARQQMDMSTALTRLAAELEQNRRQDMQLVGRSLHEFDLYTDSRFRRNEGVLGQLIPVVMPAAQDGVYR